MNEAIRQVTHVQNIRYDKATERLYIIDQTLLPNEEKEIELRTVEEMIEAIKLLRIRGAPAIGICAGYCMYALARDIDAKDNETFYRKLQIDGELLGAARPTAVNLRWAVEEMLDTAKAHLKDDRAELLEALYRKAVDIHEDDIAKCTAISEYGLSLLKDGDGVLTHCNAGPLATSRYGTGQGPFLLAAERGIHIRVFADETRPLLQGARLTSYELQRAGVDVTLICDNMASMVMKNGWVQACFVGCDRVAANGDTANKIGTSGVAILAKHYGIPVYVLGPTSTIDMACPDGDHIPIEQRDPEEITVQAKEENKPDIAQYRIDVGQNDKAHVMAQIIRAEGHERVMAFCNTKGMTERLKAFLMMEGLEADCIHGDIPQKKREAVMARFRRGELPIFVATDVAARGIDVDDVDAVFNYDVPLENEYYVHRIGRTGRAKRRGVAYTLVSDYPSGMRLDGIAKFTGNEVKKAHLDAEGKLVED